MGNTAIYVSMADRWELVLFRSTFSALWASLFPWQYFADIPQIFNIHQLIKELFIKSVSPAGPGLGLEETFQHFIRTFNAIHLKNCGGISTLQTQPSSHKEVKKKKKTYEKRIVRIKIPELDTIKTLWMMAVLTENACDLSVMYAAFTLLAFPHCLCLLL